MDDVHECSFPGSSRVSYAWWHPDTNELLVRFPDGNKTRFHDVDEMTWTEFKRAGSAGRYLNQVLTAQHRYEPY